MFFEQMSFFLLRTVYKDKSHISMYALPVMLAVTFGVTASNDSVDLYVYAATTRIRATLVFQDVA